MKRFVTGDTHGCYKGLVQALKRANFKKTKDQLIHLGDIADGFSETYKIFEYLNTIKNLITIQGNHDMWLLDWIKTGFAPLIWTEQGGDATLKSFSGNGTSIAQKILSKAVPFFVSDDNKIFVHGGFNPQQPIEDQLAYNIMWDRDMIYRAIEKKEKVSSYDEIYLGHTDISDKGDKIPLRYGNVWCLDTGAGWKGRVSVMDIDSKEIFLSDLSEDLYGKNQGR